MLSYDFYKIFQNTVLQNTSGRLVRIYNFHRNRFSIDGSYSWLALSLVPTYEINLFSHIFLWRINLILLVRTLWIISKKIILQFFLRLFVYSHKNNIKMFWYYSRNILIRLLRSKKDHRNICYFWRQFFENEWKNKVPSFSNLIT